MINYLGNQSLLKLPKTAFLASSTIHVDMVLHCYDWAIRMRDEGRCVVSGFNSRLERDVFNFLKDGNQPIIIVLARRIYKLIPPVLQPLLDKGRLLIISTSSAVRQSKTTAFIRNQYVCELADEILFIGVNESSSLAALKEAYQKKRIEI